MSREEPLLSEARCCACVCFECGRIRGRAHLQAHVSDAQGNEGFFGVENDDRDKEDLFFSARYRYVRWGLRTSRRRRNRRRERSARSKRQWCRYDAAGWHGCGR